MGRLPSDYGGTMNSIYVETVTGDFLETVNSIYVETVTRDYRETD